MLFPQTKKQPKKTTTKKTVTKKTSSAKKAVKKPIAKKGTKKSVKKSSKDVKTIAKPKINAPKQVNKAPTKTLKVKSSSLDTTVIMEKPVMFPDGSPFKELGILNEDTTTIDDNLGEVDIIETEEEIKVDSEWVKIYEDHEWMEDWSTKRVNPYNFDPKKMEKTAIFLIDSAAERYWSKPLHRCTKTSDFGPRWGRFHYGVDLGLTTGDSIFAAFDGLVRVVSWDPNGYGNFIVVRHYNGLETVYGHMSRTHSKTGDYVKAGELIGFGGSTGRSTGPHLHFELRYAGQPIDPKFFYDFDNCELKMTSCFLSASNFNYQNVVRKVYYHKVRSGETLYRIAKKYRVSVAQLRRLNGLSANAKLRAGRRIRIR